MKRIPQHSIQMMKVGIHSKKRDRVKYAEEKEGKRQEKFPFIQNCKSTKELQQFVSLNSHRIIIDFFYIEVISHHFSLYLCQGLCDFISLTIEVV